MGSGMAGRVLTAGFPLAVYNRNPEKTAPFAKAGAYVARTPRDAAARADIIITMLADDNASRAVWLDKETRRPGRSSSRHLASRIQHRKRAMDSRASRRRKRETM